MDIPGLSIVMNQNKLQDSVALNLMKITMVNNKENSNQIIEMMETMAIDPNVGQHLDAIA